MAATSRFIAIMSQQILVYTMIPNYASLFFIFLKKFVHNNSGHFFLIIVQNAVKGFCIPSLHLI